jgi:hypothetical protein
MKASIYDGMREHYYLCELNCNFKLVTRECYDGMREPLDETFDVMRDSAHLIYVDSKTNQ